MLGSLYYSFKFLEVFVGLDFFSPFIAWIQSANAVMIFSTVFTVGFVM